METNIIQITPVLPSQNIERDIIWYKEKMDFSVVSQNTMYAVLKRGDLFIHLQWHAGTSDDPLLGGSVVKIFVKNIQIIFDEMLEKETVNKESLILNTSWNTHEFGFYDLNNNAIFIVENIKT